MRSLLAACLLLAGCLAPVQPAPSTGAWSSWNGPMVMHGFGYGFIGADAEGFGPAVPFTAVDPSGKVLWFAAAHAIDAPEGARINFSADLEAWRPIVAPLLQDGFLLGSPGRVVARVTELRTGTVPTADWETARAVLEHGLDSAREPRDRDPDSQTVDGGTERIVAGSQRVVLDPHNDDGGGGWAEAREQMGLLRQWLHPEA